MMKNIAFFSVITLMLFSCSKNDRNNNNCNNLQNINVYVDLNLNFLEYNDLTFIGNSIYVSGYGNGGLIVTNTGTGFVAFDAADPNHLLDTCSILSISQGEGICGCSDANKYSLFTGQPLENPDLRCGLKAYRAELSGSNLIIN